MQPQQASAAAVSKPDADGTTAVLVWGNAKNGRSKHRIKVNGNSHPRTRSLDSGGNLRLLKFRIRQPPSVIDDLRMITLLSVAAHTCESQHLEDGGRRIGSLREPFTTKCF